MAAAARREREQRATEAVAKLERLKAGWKENQTLQAAAAAGDSSAVGKKQKVLLLCTFWLVSIALTLACAPMFGLCRPLRGCRTVTSSEQLHSQPSCVKPLLSGECIVWGATQLAEQNQYGRCELSPELHST